MQEKIVEEQIPSVNNLTLDADEFDGISYYRTNSGEYKFIIFKLSEPQADYEVTDLGHKFIMVFSGNGTNEVSEAILGDPLHILKNFVKAKCEGLIIKKCKKGVELVDRLVRKVEMVRMAQTLDALVRAKQANVV